MNPISFANASVDFRLALRLNASLPASVACSDEARTPPRSVVHRLDGSLLRCKRLLCRTDTGRERECRREREPEKTTIKPHGNRRVKFGLGQIRFTHLMKFRFRYS